MKEGGGVAGNFGMILTLFRRVLYFCFPRLVVRPPSISRVAKDKTRTILALLPPLPTVVVAGGRES